MDAIRQALHGLNRLYFNAISQSQISTAPLALRIALADKLVGVVHNPVPCDDLPLPASRGDYFVMVARINPDKGQDRAVRYCRRLGAPLVLAGPIDDMTYFDETVRPFIDDHHVIYLDSVGGEEKDELLARARGALSTHRWAEPFGMGPLEACARGTGVVAMRLGAFTETIRHGQNGFLGDKRSFVGLMRRIDEIDPDTCRRVIQTWFSPEANVAQYLKLYELVIERSGRR